MVSLPLDSIMTLTITMASTQKDLSPSNSPSGLSTEMGNVKVAMLPATFQNWSTLYILCGIVLPDFVTHGRYCDPVPRVTRPRAKH